MQPVLGRRDDARLVLPAERERVASARGGVAIGSGRPAGRERTGGQAGDGDTAADQATPGESATLLLLGRLLGQDSTAPVSWESGSESALTAFARSLISSGVSWS
jgi:hypothetical protein